jgi:putative ABC transport system ATP-binding protein
MREDALVRLCNVSRVYDPGRAEVRAVGEVSLTVDRGEFVAVMGPSGCGKSTLLHIIGAMDRPTEGEVWLGDVSLHRASEDELTRIRLSAVGFVFQFFHLLPTLSAAENVALPLLLAGVGPGVSARRAGAILERVGLGGRGDRRPADLSGGERQRVAVARAIVHNPPLVVADEPTGNLDSENGESILDLLGGLEGTAVVMATHSDAAARRADRILKMRDGCLSPASL